MHSIQQSRLVTEDQAKGITLKLHKAVKKGVVAIRQENNPYMMATFNGVEPNVSNKWNVKIFNYSLKKDGCSIVCNDWQVLDRVISENWDQFEAPDLPVISLDDAGWGFPLCGVMVGASDGNEVKTAVITEKWFKDWRFEKKEYLEAYAVAGMGLVEKEFGATPDTHRIEICTGYVNVKLREYLRHLGFDVRVVEIKGLLQDELEIKFKDYVKQTIGQDIYYDPKEMNKDDIPLEYHKCVEFGIKHFPHLLKSGWKSMKGVLN